MAGCASILDTQAPFYCDCFSTTGCFLFSTLSLIGISERARLIAAEQLLIHSLALVSSDVFITFHANGKHIYLMNKQASLNESIVTASWFGFILGRIVQCMCFLLMFSIPSTCFNIRSTWYLTLTTWISSLSTVKPCGVPSYFWARKASRGTIFSASG